MPLELLYREVDYPAWWAWLAAALAVCALAVLAVGIWRWRASRPGEVAPDDSLERCRSEALTGIEKASAMADPRRACQEISRVTRRFVGLASGGDADYSSAEQLRRAARLDPRLAAVARFAGDTQTACFDPASTPDVDTVAARARRVVDTWR
ncbi:DUF4381 family protein [Tessaracoccus massiliensis]|uniref:DUF4381 family protein n=1 Tax=Tessaracoccus massiliensis TaxID=1522311 RepID=UPI00059077E3|nr:DUF4381 family protein [Tessaracoccus massiliensis]